MIKVTVLTTAKMVIHHPLTSLTIHLFIIRIIAAIIIIRLAARITAILRHQVMAITAAKPRQDRLILVIVDQVARRIAAVSHLLAIVVIPLHKARQLRQVSAVLSLLRHRLQLTLALVVRIIRCLLLHPLQVVLAVVRVIIKTQHPLCRTAQQVPGSQVRIDVIPGFCPEPGIFLSRDSLCRLYPYGRFNRV